MRVLFLQQQPCSRSLKYAAGLATARPDWRLGFAYQGKTLDGWYGSGDELFERWWDLGDDPVRRLPDVLAEWRPDVIHSHNLPDTLTVLANEVAGDVPVIHDVHDLQSLRQTRYENGFAQPENPRRLERRAVEESAALVAVSDELLHEIAVRHRLPARTLVFPNYALGRDLPRLGPFFEHRAGNPPRLVYEGTLSTNGGHYDLREIFAALVAQGVTLDVYPSRPVPEYAQLAESLPGMTVHETIDPYRLMRILPRYDFGWAGFNTALNGPHVDTALPNKAFDYLVSGLPVLTLNHRALRRMLREHGWGISVDRPEDLGPELARRDLDKLRRRVAAARADLTVEANIERLAALYEQVVSETPAVAETA
ncbi:MAG: glycosyltransferase [Actinobacteria bacterium]|nr:glycosyltransferase [Actinomycetota bacterium]